MDRLPNELVCMLSWYVCKRCAKSLGTTCKRFHSVVLKRIWNDVRFDNYIKIDLRLLSSLPIKVVRVQNFHWAEVLGLHVHRFSALQHVFFEHTIYDLREIEMLKNCTFTVHVSTKRLIHFTDADEFISILKRMKNVHLSIEAGEFNFDIDDLQKIGGVTIERFNTGGICFCTALDDYKTAFLQTLELLQPNNIDLRPLPICCSGLMKFEAMDLTILSAYPVRSFYVGLIKWPRPLISNPPLQTIQRLFAIPTLEKVFTDYKFGYLDLMGNLKKNVTIIKLW